MVVAGVMDCWLFRLLVGGFDTVGDTGGSSLEEVVEWRDD